MDSEEWKKMWSQCPCGKPIDQDFQCDICKAWLGNRCADCHRAADLEDLAEENNEEGSGL